MDEIRQKIYTLEIDEVIEKDHWLGINTSLEPYQLAFNLNRNSRLRLIRSKKDIFNEKKRGVFQHFEWIDPINNIVCNLLSNKFIIEKNQNKLNKNVLFKLPERNELYLFNEFKSWLSNNLNVMKNKLNWLPIELDAEVRNSLIQNLERNAIFDLED